MSLPRKTGTAAKNKRVACEPGVSKGAAKSLTPTRIETTTILVVDDESAMLNLCREILKLGGYDVLQASGGQEALRLFQNSKTAIHLVLLDVGMPGMNGIDLAKRLQRSKPNARVVLMSGCTREEIARLAGGDNPYRIIWKPFRSESLLRMIENVLDTPLREI